MKKLLLFILLFSNFALAMDAPPSRKRLAEEEQPSPQTQKIKREVEQAVIIREPVLEVETQSELSPEVQENIHYLRAIAESGEFPNEIGAQILKNLANAKVRGATEEQKLYNAIANIRSFMEAFPQFYGDVGINGYLIQELAKRYAHNSPVKVAIALATTGSGNWLAGYMAGQGRRNLLDYFLKAADRGDLGTVNFILKYFPQSINERGSEGSTPLIAAVRDGETEIVDRLLKEPGINVNEADYPDEHTALMIAALNGNMQMIERLLQAPGINVNAKNLDNNTSLILAAIDGHTAVVERLLQVPGIDVNAENYETYTALIEASRNGHAQVVERLLQAPGIDVNINTSEEQGGLTALGFAKRSNNPNKDAIIKRLIEAGAIE